MGSPSEKATPHQSKLHQKSELEALTVRRLANLRCPFDQRLTPRPYVLRPESLLAQVSLLNTSEYSIMLGSVGFCWGLLVVFKTKALKEARVHKKKTGSRGVIKRNRQSPGRPMDLRADPDTRSGDAGCPSHSHRTPNWSKRHQVCCQICRGVVKQFFEFLSSVVISAELGTIHRKAPYGKHLDRTRAR